MVDTSKNLSQIKNFIISNYLAAISTTDKLCPYVSHIYYATEDGESLYFVSRNDSMHTRNLQNNQSIAGSMHEHYKDFEPGGEIVAVQFVGYAKKVTDKTELHIRLDFYGAKLLGTKVWYPKIDEIIKKDAEWSLYKITVEKAKIRSSRDSIEPREYMFF